jgi:integrase
MAHGIFTCQNAHMKNPKENKKRPRGMGQIHKRGPYLYITYSKDGREYRESSHSQLLSVAEGLLKRRLAEITTGKFRGLETERLTVGNMVEDLFRRRRNGEVKGIKSLEWEERRWSLHLKPVFEHVRAKSVTARTLSKYIADRREEKAEPATINRELAILRRAFRLYREEVTMPIFTLLPEDNARREFLPDEAYTKLAAACASEGLWFRALLAVAVGTGWRKGELLEMRVRHIDLKAKRLTLDASMSKNGRPRRVAINAEMLPLLGACIEGKADGDFVFTKNGVSVRGILRDAWDRARKAAGVPDFLFHSLRRTFARSARRMGISEGVIMQAGGWETRSIFERYNIKDDSDMDALARAQDEAAALRNSTVSAQSAEKLEEIVN